MAGAHPFLDGVSFRTYDLPEGGRLMRRFALATGILIMLMCAAPASADALGGCKVCVERWLWPWLEDCYFCESATCGSMECSIQQCAPGLDCCVTAGEFCGEGNPECDDPSPHGAVRSGAEAELADCTRSPFLAETWRLARVRVTTRHKRG
jgi:hypothetical protein